MEWNTPYNDNKDFPLESCSTGVNPRHLCSKWILSVRYLYQLENSFLLWYLVGYDVRVVNNMGVEVTRGEQGNLAVKVKPDFPPGLFKGKSFVFEKLASI